MIDINKLRDRAATFGSDYLTDEEWVEVISRLEVAEKERDFAKVEVSRLHDDIHELTDERDTYKAVHSEWIAKTEWVQDELTRGKLPAKYLGMHRADGIKVEIDALRVKVKQMDAALESLLIRCDDSDSAMYGTLSTSFVRDTVRIARLALEESK